MKSLTPLENSFQQCDILIRFAYIKGVISFSNATNFLFSFSLLYFSFSLSLFRAREALNYDLRPATSKVSSIITESDRNANIIAFNFSLTKKTRLDRLFLFYKIDFNLIISMQYYIIALTYEAIF